MNSCQCQVDECVLCPARLSDELTPEQVCQVRGLLSRHDFSPGEFLFQAGEPRRRIYMVRSGQVKLTRTLPDGREKIVAVCRAGEIAGFGALDQESYTHSAQALTPVAACGLAYKNMLRVLECDPAVSLRMIRLLNRELARAEAHISELGLKTAPERIASFLLSLAPHDGCDPHGVPLPFSRQEMAEFLGLTLETVSRVIADWVRQGIIRAPRARREYVILDILRLRRLTGTAPERLTPPAAAACGLPRA